MEALNALIERVITALPAIGSGAAVIAGFWIAAKILQSLTGRVSRRVGLEAVGLATLVSALVFWSVIGFGLVTDFGTMGINVSALVASLGLTGFALGFALRDAISNLLAGVLILLYRPFHVGDHIKVAGLEGKVAALDLRYTTILDKDHRHLIPNQTLYTNPVSVLQASPATSAD
jgi:small conductance mechanosensitive channel